MAKKKDEEKKDEEKKEEKSTRRKEWDIRQNDFLKALKETLDEGGNKDDLRDKVIEYTKSYNGRRSTSNCTNAKISYHHRLARKLTGKELAIAPSGSLSPEQRIMWKDAFSDYE
jgi:hypothetical protein